MGIRNTEFTAGGSRACLWTMICGMILLTAWGCSATPSATSTDPAPRVTNKPVLPDVPLESTEIVGTGDSKAKRFALLVGVNHYGQPLQDLQFCVQDMQALKWELTNYAGYGPEDVPLQVDTGQLENRPTKQVVFDWMEKHWQNLREQDTVLFAFSGLGLTKNGQAYVDSSDADPYATETNAIPVDQVYESLQATGAGSQLLIVVACRNISAAKSLADDDLPAAVDVQRLARMGSSVTQLFSCNDGEKSFEDPDLDSVLLDIKGHGVFMYYLIRGLTSREADADGDQRISPHEILHYTNQHVVRHVEKLLENKSTGERSRLLTQQPRLVFSGHVAPVLAWCETPPSAEALALPGLTGLWWSEDVPWFLPHVRLEFDPSDEADLLSSDVIAVYENLHKIYHDYLTSLDLESQDAYTRLESSEWGRTDQDIGDAIRKVASSRTAVGIQWKELPGCTEDPLKMCGGWRADIILGGFSRCWNSCSCVCRDRFGRLQP